MQAAKIKIGSGYAINLNNELKHYQVTSISTVRNSKNVQSTANGFIVDDPERSLFTRSVEDIIGPYEEQVELVEQKRCRDEERKRIADAKKAKQELAVRLLYKAVGLIPPKNLNDYHNSFRPNYSGGIDISADGVEVLVEALGQNHRKEPANAR